MTSRVQGGLFLRSIKMLAGLAVLIALGFIATAYFLGSRTLNELFTDNQRLKKALANLTDEDQIGYAKVLSQAVTNGTIFTTLRFVETARTNQAVRVFEKEFTIEGDVVHFDALIVKFQPRLVMDGRQRALYIWRRVYGETMSPQQGLLMAEPGREPERYRDLVDKLTPRERGLFWNAIWDLAGDPDRISRLGVQAVYGNAVYSKLRPGLIYVFKINASGQVFPETVPDL